MQYSEKNHKEAMDMLDSLVKKLGIKEEDIEEKKYQGLIDSNEQII